MCRVQPCRRFPKGSSNSMFFLVDFSQCFHGEKNADDQHEDEGALGGTWWRSRDCNLPPWCTELIKNHLILCSLRWDTNSINYIYLQYFIVFYEPSYLVYLIWIMLSWGTLPTPDWWAYAANPPAPTAKALSPSWLELPETVGGWPLHTAPILDVPLEVRING